MSAHACTEDQLVEQPAIGLFAEARTPRNGFTFAIACGYHPVLQMIGHGGDEHAGA